MIIIFIEETFSRMWFSKRTSKINVFMCSEKLTDFSKAELKAKCDRRSLREI